MNAPVTACPHEHCFRAQSIAELICLGVVSKVTPQPTLKQVEAANAVFSRTVAKTPCSHCFSATHAARPQIAPTHTQGSPNAS